MGEGESGQDARAARRESELSSSSAKCRRRAGLARCARSTGRSATLGVPLLAERTIAVDARAIPLGAPVFLATTMPLSTTPLQRLVMAQDTGGAIRGAVRADFFWGFGREAGTRSRPDAAGRPDVAAVAEGRRPQPRASARYRASTSPPPACRRDTTSAPARRPRRGGSPSRSLRARTSANVSGCT